MKMRIAIFTFLASAALCHVQAINISGVVRNSEEKGIEGTTVQLVITGIKTVTGPDGSFILTDNTAVVRDQTCLAASGRDRPFIFEHLRLLFNVVEEVQVKAAVNDCNGRRRAGHIPGLSAFGECKVYPVCTVECI